MSSLTDLSEPTSTPRLRSGTAARLAGLPVTTLRVWERRYGVVAASKTPTGQRLYSSHDVARLRLLRQLTHGGHAIGTIAALGLEPLQALAADMPLPDVELASATRRVVVIGRSAAHKLEAVARCDVVAVHEDLDQAERQAETPHAVDVLLVRLASLQPALAERVTALAARWHAAETVVLYGFGTEPTADALRAAGARVRREPVTGRELAQLMHGAREMSTPVAPPLPVAPRRFSDDALAELAERPSPVACECLRHMSEIVMQLAAFERYSEDCLSRGPADAALHRHLGDVAGAARSLFEQALQRVVDDEGLATPSRR